MTTPKATPIDFDAVPAQGGSYTRQPDGSLVRQSESEPAADAAQAPAPQE